MIAVDLRKPLFIPLNKGPYAAFKDGTKARSPEGFMEEYRRAGVRWNAQNCTVGRQVILSCGYGKRDRMIGRVASFRHSTDPCHTEAWIEIYGIGGTAACIGVTDLQLLG